MKRPSLADRAIEVRALVESGKAAELRASRQLSLEVSARTIGVSTTTLFRWERGQRTPQGRNLVAYHKFLTRLSHQVPA